MATSIVQSGNTLGVKSDVVGPYKYQWKRNGKMMGGPQWVSHTLSDITAADYDAKWSVTVYGESATEESTVFTMTRPVAKPAHPTAPVAHAAAPKDLKSMGFTDAQIAAMKKGK